MVRKTFALIGVLLLVSLTLLFVPQVEWGGPAWKVMLICSGGLSAAFLHLLWRQRSGAPPEIVVDVRRTHFVQAMAQSSIYFYVGYYYAGGITSGGIAQWAPFIVYQLLAAFVFDFVLSVYRQNRYKLGFSIFPIVLSVNLFMWFRPEYFWGQLAIIFGGILAKAYVVRKLEGRTVHIFNPSALPMAVITILVVLVLNREDMLSTNNVVASYLVPPHLQLFTFMAGLFSHLASGVAFISLGAVSTLVLIDGLFRAFTGLPPMGDIIHPSVFIGITLLVTDPVTSSKTRTGQLIYGCLYGVGICTTYILLQRFGYPTYYDKILPVPILNFFSPYLDRIRVPLWGPMKSPVWKRPWAPVAVYAPVFLLLVTRIEDNFLRRTFFLEKYPPKVEARAERRLPVDPVIGVLINRRVAERCHENPALDACRLIAPRAALTSG